MDLVAARATKVRPKAKSHKEVLVAGAPQDRSSTQTSQKQFKEEDRRLSGVTPDKELTPRLPT